MQATDKYIPNSEYSVCVCVFVCVCVRAHYTRRMSKESSDTKFIWQ